MNRNSGICVFVLLLVGSFAFAQQKINAVSFDHIRQPKVKAFILQQLQENVFFSELKPSLIVDDEVVEFTNFEKTYILKESPDFVWDNYKFSDQTDVWDMNRVSFGMLFCRGTQSIVYADQIFYGMEKGQIYFLNLKILNGLYNLPVAFEIINVDQGKRLFEFSYLKGGKASGKQSIQFVETENGYTEIIHKSYVKSDSKFRDKYLYPFFHNKIINEFHSNMRRMIANNSKNRQDNLAESK